MQWHLASKELRRNSLPYFSKYQIIILIRIVGAVLLTIMKWFMTSRSCLINERVDFVGSKDSSPA